MSTNISFFLLKERLWNLENKGLEPKYCFNICFYETKSQLVQPVSLWKLEVEPKGS